MADKFLGGVRPGQTDVSIAAFFRSLTDNSELTGLLATDINASYWRQGGSRVSITASDLTAVDDPHSDGGFFETDTTNMPGLYRFDVPDAAFAAGADWVVVTITATGAFVYVERFNLTRELAAPGDQMDLVDAPNSNAVDAIALPVMNRIGDPANDYSYSGVSYGQNLLNRLAMISHSILSLNFIGNRAIDNATFSISPITGQFADADQYITLIAAHFVQWPEKYGYTSTELGSYQDGVFTLNDVARSEVSNNGDDYICIRPHKSSAVNSPGVGPQWEEFWLLGGGGGSGWQEATTYTAGWGLGVNTIHPDAFRINLNASASANDVPEIVWGIYSLGTLIHTFRTPTIPAGAILSSLIPSKDIDGGRVDTSGTTGTFTVDRPFSNRADLVAIDGNPTDDNSAVLRLKSLHLESDSNTVIPLVVRQSAINGFAAQIEASQTGGIGLALQGEQIGLSIMGVNNYALALGSDTGGGLIINPGTDGIVVNAGDGTGNGSAVILNGGPTSGNGINITTTQGNGIAVTAGGGGNSGININGDLGVGISGTQYGMVMSGSVGLAVTSGDGIAVDILGGTDGVRVVAGDSAGSGTGVRIVAGSVAGDGVNINSASGRGIDVLSDAHAMVLTSQSQIGLWVTGQQEGIYVKSNTMEAIEAQSIGSNALRLRTTGTGDAVLIEGGTVSGDGISITTTDGDGFHVAADGANRKSVRLSTVDGDGIAIVAQGATRAGVSIASIGGHGVKIDGGTGGYSGISVYGQGNGEPAVRIANTGQGNGIDVVTAQGHALLLDSSADASGDGLKINAGRRAMMLSAGQTFPGVYIEGGITSGDGVKITTTDGMGVNIESNGPGGKAGIRAYHADGDGIGMIVMGGGGGMQIGGFSGTGLQIGSNAVGDGVAITSSDGHALSILSAANNKSALYIQSTGDPGEGVTIEQTGSGDALKITTINGHGINVLANGSSSSIHGINVDQQTGGSAVHLVSENRHALQLSSGGSSRSPLHIFGLNPAYPAVHIEQFGATGEGLKITTVDGDGIFIDAGGTGLDINAPNSDLGITGGGGGQIYEYVGTVRQYSGPQPVFRMVDANGAPITGLVAADFTVTVYKRGQLTGVVMLDLYKAIAEDANGYYTFATNDDSIFFDVPGITKIIIESAGAQTVYLACNVVNTDGSDANLVSINGNPVTDYSAVLRLRQLDIQSPDDVAFRARGGGANPGAQFEGGETGRGLELIGGPTSGDGMMIQAPTSGMGLRVLSANGNPAVRVAGSGTGEGLVILGGSTADGIRIQGGGTSGRGVAVVTTDGHGVEVSSAGTGKVDVLATKDVAITAITYNPDNTYNTITLADGRVITFTYAAGILQGVSYS